MPTTMTFANRWVIVTGASSGLGYEMASQLASEHKANLILVARRSEKLHELKQKLEKENGVQCAVITADLSKIEDIEHVYHESIAIGDIYAVVLNAGVTYFGEQSKLGLAGFQKMLATNVSAIVHFVDLYVPYLKAKNQGGGILLISSMASMVPVPFQSAYAGTKAFVTNFGLSLIQELRDSNISLTVFAPGGIRTPMTTDSDLKKLDNPLTMQKASDCAREAIYALQHRHKLYVPRLLNRVQLFATRLVPRNFIAALTYSTFKKAMPQ